VTLTKAALFAAGYVLGAKAGRERYAQILDVAARASDRLEELSARGGAHRRPEQDHHARERSRRG
jgi:hypothetical protein